MPYSKLSCCRFFPVSSSAFQYLSPAGMCLQWIPKGQEKVGMMLMSLKESCRFRTDCPTKEIIPSEGPNSPKGQIAHPRGRTQNTAICYSILFPASPAYKVQTPPVTALSLPPLHSQVHASCCCHFGLCGSEAWLPGDFSLLS